MLVTINHCLNFQIYLLQKYHIQYSITCAFICDLLLNNTAKKMMYIKLGNIFCQEAKMIESALPYLQESFLCSIQFIQ